MNRRKFLYQAGLVSAGTIAALGTHGWVARTPAANGRNRLIVVFLRGAVDGLNVVVPYKDEAYYEARPTIAIPRPGESGGALDLTGGFGLHPALASLVPLWQQKSLAFVHACGSQDVSRSHFEAQDRMESGTGTRVAADGWMNRLLGLLPNHTPTHAVNLGESIPKSLMGKVSVANLPLGRVANAAVAIDRPQISAAFDRLYGGTDALSKAYQEGRQAREKLLADLNAEMMEASKGAPSPVNFASDTKKLARLMVRDPGIQLGFLALGGWDTHVNEGGSRGQLSNRLKPLGEGLATLAQELGPVYKDTAIVVMSEFGRTVKENGNGGTDHGHGNALWVMGGAVKGGQVYGQWNGLTESQLHEGRDLAVLTDYRDPIASLLQRHMGLSKAQLSKVFPGFTPQSNLALV